eukprot:6273415-Amphidinium_carterae.1
MPDIWVIAGIDENTILDILLSVVMALFTLELLALSLSDPSHGLSRFASLAELRTCKVCDEIVSLSSAFTTLVSRMEGGNPTMQAEELTNMLVCQPKLFVSPRRMNRPSHA